MTSLCLYCIVFMASLCLCSCLVLHCLYDVFVFVLMFVLYCPYDVSVFCVCTCVVLSL